MTLEEIRRVAIYEMGFNPRKDDNVDLLARFAIAVLDALDESPDSWFTGPPGEIIRHRIAKNLERLK